MEAGAYARFGGTRTQVFGGKERTDHDRESRTAVLLQVVPYLIVIHL